MTRVRVDITVSLDGFVAGPNQTLEHPLGENGERLHEWAFAAVSWREQHGLSGGEANADSDVVQESQAATGAVVMGRRMFSGGDGPWADDPMANGWWGDDPPFHTPVFILTHHPRPTIEMKGGTTFHFIDASPAEALETARAAAGRLDVRIGGGPSTIRQFLAADLIDHMHIAIVPAVLARGERLWDGLQELERRFNVEAVSSPSGVTHLTFTRR